MDNLSADDVRPVADIDVPGIDSWLQKYDLHLTNVVGLAQATRRKYCFFVKRFLIHHFGKDTPDWTSLKTDHLTTFIQREANRLERNSRMAPITALRAMIRYLVFQGAVPERFVEAIPTMRKWKHEALPKFLSEDEVDLLVAATLKFNTRSMLRNHAIMLLLARLGLRANEVCHLTLDDIDWTAQWERSYNLTTYRICLLGDKGTQNLLRLRRLLDKTDYFICDIGYEQHMIGL